MFKFSMLMVKENEYTLREASPSNLFGPSCEKGSTLKEKNLLSKGANSFFLEHPFSEGDQWTGKQTGSYCKRLCNI